MVFVYGHDHARDAGHAGNGSRHDHHNHDHDDHAVELQLVQHQHVVLVLLLFHPTPPTNPNAGGTTNLITRSGPNQRIAR